LSAISQAIPDESADVELIVLGQVLQEERVHRALQSDVQVRDVAFRQRDDVDAGEVRRLKSPAVPSWFRLNRSKASASATPNRPPRDRDYEGPCERLRGSILTRVPPSSIDRSAPALDVRTVCFWRAA
jgi:hypothetical protein